MGARAVPLPPSSAAEPGRPPPWWPVIWATLLGYLLALVFGFVAWIVLLLLGVVHSGGTAGAYPETALDWPYLRNGMWSALANTAFIAAGLGLASWTVQQAVAERTGRETSFAAVFGTLIVTGYVPVAAYPGLLPFNGILALLATAALVRSFAVDGRVTRPRMRWRAAIVGATATAVLLVAVPYGVLHPLWFEAAASPAGREATLGGERAVVYRSSESTLVTYEFSLDNTGFADVVVTGLDRGDHGGLIDVQAVYGASAPSFHSPARLSESRRPLGEFAVAGRDSAFLTLVLHVRGCRSARGTDTIDRVRLRYRVLGVDAAAPIPLVPAPTVRCP